MKLLLVVLIAAAVASALPRDESLLASRGIYPRFIKFTDEQGVEQSLDLDEQPDTELLSTVARNPANNLYLLFTRKNRDQPQTLEINNEASIRNSNFDPTKPIIVVVHGWLGHQERDLNPTIRDAYLDKDDVNIIIMEWRGLAISGYITAASGVPLVGVGLGQFLEYLNTITGAPLSNMHLVGFSLGAHLVGNAGRYLRGQVARITGLDPAGPLWHYSSNRLAATDAIYVEGIHTDGGYMYGLGIGKDVGHADFFPNGGNYQPGCITSLCNHNRAWAFFAATVSYNHLIAKECTTGLQLTLNRCRGQEFPMGNDDLKKFGRGTYRVNTARRYPY